MDEIETPIKDARSALPAPGSRVEAGGDGEQGPTPAAAGGQEIPTDLAENRPQAHDFVSFYREFTPRLVRFLLWQGAQFADAADIAQESMRLAYQHWANLRQPRAWVRLVASREMVRRAARVAEEPIDGIPEPCPLVSDLDAAELWEQRQSVLRLLASLPPRQRQVMAWTYEGYTPTEIAALLRIEASAVRSNLRKARRALARRATDLWDRASHDS